MVGILSLEGSHLKTKKTKTIGVRIIIYFGLTVKLRIGMVMELVDNN